MTAQAAASAAPTSRPARWLHLTSHWLFGVVFTAGVALRVVTFLAYQPALLYIDSLGYLANISELRPTGARPRRQRVPLRRPGFHL